MRRLARAVAPFLACTAIGLVLLAAYVVGEDRRCNQLAADGSPAATTYCSQGATR
jgi:hypothetical protein